MELVTLACVTLHRIGSASRASFGCHRELKLFREAPEASSSSLLGLIKSIAIEHGEGGDALQGMRHQKGWNSSEQCETLVFEVSTPNVQYSCSYAECWTFPALKIGDRYFKLAEVKMGTS